MFGVVCSELYVLAIRVCVWLATLFVIGNFAANAQPTNVPAPASYSTFSKFIAERNIFNPNRFARAANTRYRQRSVPVRRNSFGLAGTMSYDEGENAGLHAFFDGTSADYRKVLQPGGTLGVFKIADITPDSVTLLHDTNKIVLKIGQQMRDDGQGRWALSPEIINYAKASTSDSPRNRRGDQRNDQGETVPENSEGGSLDGIPMIEGAVEGEAPAEEAEAPAETNTNESTALPSGPGSDILRRLMELRAQEEQPNRN